jgi:hypothetical protein
MRIRNFIVADAVSGGPQGKWFVHGGGVTEISAFEFPYIQAKLGLLITLVYDGPEDDTEQDVEIAIVSDAGVETAKLLQLHAPKPPEAFEARESWQLIHLIGDVSGLRFDEPGRYWVVLKLNGNEMDRMLLDVERLGPPSSFPSEAVS